MKKIIYTCIISVTALTLIGCENQKTLECSQTTATTDYGTQTETYKVTFKENKMITEIITRKIVLLEAMKQYKDDLFNSIKLGMEEANNKKGIKIETSLVDSTIETKTTATIDELDNDAQNYLGLDKTQTYDTMKQTFTDNGYTCK